MTNEIKYDMPICIEHRKELQHHLNKLMVAWIVTIVLAFVWGYAFCKTIGG